MSSDEFGDGANRPVQTFEVRENGETHSVIRVERDRASSAAIRVPTTPHCLPRARP
jgi:hypothetical protein